MHFILFDIVSNPENGRFQAFQLVKSTMIQAWLFPVFASKLLFF